MIAVALRLPREVDDRIGIEAVALRFRIVAAQATVHAVLPADIRKLDEPAQMHAVTDVRLSHAVCGLSQPFRARGIAEQTDELPLCELVRPFRLFDEAFDLLPAFLLVCHGRFLAFHFPVRAVLRYFGAAFFLCSSAFLSAFESGAPVRSMSSSWCFSAYCTIVR